MNDKDKILVEIASYRDPELLNTVYSAIIQADYPERVFFAICDQSDNMEIYEKLKINKNCKIKKLKESEARGSCYARYLCQQMIDDEKYIFQIDSHMRFVKHWDTKLIEELLSLNDKKAIISFYPAYCTEEMMKLPLYDKKYDEPTEGCIMFTTGFHNGDSYFLKINSMPINKDDPLAKTKSVFMGAGNFFTFSEAHKEVLHDPNMYFYGDELAMAIRLYTHGWNIYNSGEGYVYHQYERKNQKFPPVENGMSNELNRLLTLIGVSKNKEDLGEFGLGNERTLEDFEKFSGIDFKNRIIHLNAESGEIENEELRNKISFFSTLKKEKEEETNKAEKIEILIVDLFNEYEKCIDVCLNNAVNKEKINFIVASRKTNRMSKENLQKKHIKKYIHLKRDETYSQGLSKISEYVGDCYIAIVDSSVRFLKGWDKYLLANIKECGKNSALTSWVWKASEETDAENFMVYNNIPKEFKEFYYYLPYLYYDEKNDLSKRKNPYKTPFISDGFLFCHSNIIKKVKIDPNITYEEQKYLYSLRLWTNGIDIYYPNFSYMVRTKEESLLNSEKQNYDIRCIVSRVNSFYNKKTSEKYDYDIGNARPIWGWYEMLKVDYDKNLFEIKEKPKT